VYLLQKSIPSNLEILESVNNIHRVNKDISPAAENTTQRKPAKKIINSRLHLSGTKLSNSSLSTSKSIPSFRRMR